jgi:tRNA threonylcarbamoyladenosine biosynthesis protein TsaE
MTNSQKMFYCANENEQLNFGGKLANACDHKSCVIFLQGDLGAGKTTLTRGFLRTLGYTDKVKSPTYTLIETYQLSDHQILHIDLYRIKKPDEIDALGIRDLIDAKTSCLVEWPDHALEKLPPADLTCYIAPSADGRQIQLVAETTRGKEILNNMVWA